MITQEEKKKCIKYEELNLIQFVKSEKPYLRRASSFFFGVIAVLVYKRDYHEWKKRMIFFFAHFILQFSNSIMKHFHLYFIICSTYSFCCFVDLPSKYIYSLFQASFYNFWFGVFIYFWQNGIYFLNDCRFLVLTREWRKKLFYFPFLFVRNSLYKLGIQTYANFGNEE